MSENYSLDIMVKFTSSIRKVDNTDVVGVNVNGFVAYYKFFVFFFFISKYKNIGISDV